MLAEGKVRVVVQQGRAAELGMGCRLTSWLDGRQLEQREREESVRRDGSFDESIVSDCLTQFFHYMYTLVM